MKHVEKLFATVALAVLLCVGAGAAYADETDEATGSKATETTISQIEAISDAQNTAATTDGTAATASDAAAQFGAAQDAATDAVTDVTDSEETSAGEETDGQPLEDGTYIIESGVGAGAELDVAGASSNDGANVQIYKSNNTAAQKWELTYGDDGTYTIASKTSGKVLDVACASAEEGANVQVYSTNGTAAQKWTLVKLGNGFYTVVSALDGNLVLDAACGRNVNGTNVQIWTANGTAAQRWFFARIDSQDPSARSVADGVYRISSTTGSDNVLDVSCGSTADRANVQQWSWNGTNAQRWGVAYDEAGYYTIVNMGSGKVLDVVGANPGSATNVWQYASNGSRAQRWALDDNGDGTFTIRSLVSGMVLDVACGSGTDGANVQVYRPNGTKAQKWTLTPVSVLVTGAYIISSDLSPNSMVIDVPGASITEGQQLQIYKNNGTQAQRFAVREVSKDVYTIESLCSGLFITVGANGSVTQEAAKDSATQRWIANFSDGGVCLASAADATLVMTVDGGRATSKAPIIVSASVAPTAAQRWILRQASLIDEGYYIVQNVASGKVLDIVAGKMASGANLQQYDANGSGAQVFHFIRQGSFYQIENSRSYKSLDVKGASTSDGANVRQWVWNGTRAQLWRAELGKDVGIVFVNAASGKVLEVAGGSLSNGANVQQYTKNGSKSQAWKLMLTSKYSLTGDEAIDRYIADVVGSNSDDAYSCMMNAIRGVPGRSESDGVLRLGICDNGVINHYVHFYFENGYGDCYVCTALYTWMMRACGYNANMRGGYVQGYSGQEPHGWTEVYIDGKTYMCDATFAREYPSHNWYMRTYDNADAIYIVV